MSYRLLTGRYVIRYSESPGAGPQPDGDTIKFRPDDPTLVEDLGRASGVEPKLSAQHRISLRLEAIDALETHFEGTRQQQALGDAARDGLLSLLGFRDVRFDPSRVGEVVSANADELPGWVLSNGVEENGRLVSFAFTGQPPLVDGSLVEPDETTIRTSANVRLLSDGLVYPLLYSTLETSLREVVASVAIGARAARAGVWAESTADPDSAADVSGGGAAIRELVMWPKLFRRLATYFAGGFRGLDGFVPWLLANPAERDDALVLSDTGAVVRLHQLLEVAGSSIRLTRWPETFVVLPARAGVPLPAPVPAPTPPPASQRVGSVRLVAALVDPAGVDAGNETVTLLNTTAADVVLNGWTVSDSHGDTDRLDGTTVKAGEAVRVRLRSVLLGNRGDTVSLKDASGAVVDRVAWTAAETPRRGETLVF